VTGFPHFDAVNFRQRRMLTVVAIAAAMVLLFPPANVTAADGATQIQFVWLVHALDGTMHTLLLTAEILSLALVGVASYRVMGAA
jgi:hypothetical protein